MRVAYGTAVQNKAYCLKDDPDGFMFGIPSKSKEGQGRRTDWERVHDLAKAGSAKTDFLEEVPHLAYPHIGKIESWVSAHQPELKRTEHTRPIILYGPSGAGKSYYAAQNFPGAWEKGNRDAKSWNGYDGVSDIVINEMDGSWFRYSDLKNLLDIGVFKGELKYGGFVTVCAKRCIMTTNIHPAFWYKETRVWNNQNALRRRIKQYGELWIFRQPTEEEDGSLTFHPPERDLLLEQPGTETADEVVAVGGVLPFN